MTSPAYGPANHPAKYDRLVVIFSDIEMGAGGRADDFPHSPFLADLLLSYLDGPTAEKQIDFVFNGDTFDLLKTKYLGAYPRHVGKDISVAKMTSIAAAHPKFFEALSRIVDHESKNKSVHFIIGNHDAELLFPKAQNFIKALCGGDERVNFPGFTWDCGPLRVEHGSQSDPLFRIDPEAPFIEQKEGDLLNLPWATVMLLDVVMPLHELLYFHDRVVPSNRVTELVPEIRELLMALAWKYWTRDFWREFIGFKDPLLKFNWTMAKEIVKRFTTGDPDVQLNRDWLKQSVEATPQTLFVTGHLHKPGNFFHQGKRVIQSGCFRDEYSVSDDGKTFSPQLKNYLEIFLDGEDIAALNARELKGPARDPADIPDSVFDVVPEVQARLQQLGDLSKHKSKQKEQERKEADESENDGGG